LTLLSVEDDGVWDLDGLFIVSLLYSNDFNHTHVTGNW
jgi:hypothetical protein